MISISSQLQPEHLSTSRCTSLSEVMPKFFGSSNSSAVAQISSPSVLMPSRFMHLRARTERFRSRTGLLRIACSSAQRGRRAVAHARVRRPFFQRLAEAQALGVIISLISSQRRLAEVLAASKLLLADARQVAERADVHLLQAIAAADRQLEVGDRDSSTWLNAWLVCSSSGL